MLNEMTLFRDLLCVIMLHKIAMLFLLRSCLLADFEEASRHVTNCPKERATWQRTEANSQRETGALNSIVCKDLNPAHNCVSLGVDCPLVEPSDKIPALSAALIAALQRTLLSCAGTPDL